MIGLLSNSYLLLLDENLLMRYDKYDKIGHGDICPVAISRHTSEARRLAVCGLKNDLTCYYVAIISAAACLAVFMIRSRYITVPRLSPPAVITVVADCRLSSLSLLSVTRQT